MPIAKVIYRLAIGMLLIIKTANGHPEIIISSGNLLFSKSKQKYDKFLAACPLSELIFEQHVNF
jgi:hypothetical protein